jgi:hypothetical protein
MTGDCVYLVDMWTVSEVNSVSAMSVSTEEGHNCGLLGAAGVFCDRWFVK